MKILRNLAGFAVVTLVLVLSAPTIAQEASRATDEKSGSVEKHGDAGKEVSLTGEIVDMGCYMSHPATGRGASHKQCAIMCVKNGMPVGLLADDGTLYLLLPPHEDTAGYAKARELVAERVNVKGMLSASGGVTAVTVKSAEAAPKG